MKTVVFLLLFVLIVIESNAQYVIDHKDNNRVKDAQGNPVKATLKDFEKASIAYKQYPAPVPPEWILRPGIAMDSLYLYAQDCYKEWSFVTSFKMDAIPSIKRLEEDTFEMTYDRLHEKNIDTYQFRVQDMSKTYQSYEKNKRNRIWLLSFSRKILKDK